MTANPLRAGALAYAALGWRVFPVRSGDKVPNAPRCKRGERGHKPHECQSGRLGHGCHDATTDPSAVAEWWTRWPHANVGIATGAASRLVVVDVDNRDSLRELEQTYAWPLVTATAETANGGLHLYFAWPDTSVRNSASKVAPGIDVRGEGGYVLAPPSALRGGRKYRWTRPMRPQPIPGWLLHLASEDREGERRPVDSARAPTYGAGHGGTKYGLAALERECRAVATTPKGRRNHQLNVSAFSLGQLVAGGELHEDVAVAGLWEAARSAGLREPDRPTLHSGLAAGKALPRARRS